ncbi:hypothetical protein PVAP13_7KG326206, partial [Panicum virgatum]
PRARSASPSPRHALALAPSNRPSGPTLQWHPGPRVGAPSPEWARSPHHPARFFSPLPAQQAARACSTTPSAHGLPRTPLSRPHGPLLMPALARSLSHASSPARPLRPHPTHAGLISSVPGLPRPRDAHPADSPVQRPAQLVSPTPTARPHLSAQHFPPQRPVSRSASHQRPNRRPTCQRPLSRAPTPCHLGPRCQRSRRSPTPRSSLTARPDPPVGVIFFPPPHN